ncbi:MAG TPA: GGDEF domain-containing protein [Steroidobacteraceae bacterium]|nr:GGDEF domain-containing protein [Steroidobacteraceae bacterium]
MPHSLLNGVAAATTHRDRDDLDRAVVRLLLEFIAPHSISLLHLVDDAAGSRIEERVHMSRGAAAQRTANLTQATRQADFTAWQQHALRGQVVSCGVGGGHLMTIFPIHGASDVVAMLALETAAPLPDRTVELVRGILRIVRNHLALLDYGEQDTLTGLLNRKRFEGQFDRLRQRLAAAPLNADAPATAHRELQRQEPGWLALVDIDHFKAVNDSFGHLFGDEVLLLISGLMRRSFRGADQLFRFGGEEFIVILEQASEAGAQLALERFRNAVETYQFPQIGRVTVSVGYTRIRPTDIPTLCLARADAALYYAKSHGRNNLRNCEQLQAAGELDGEIKCGTVDLF